MLQGDALYERAKKLGVSTGSGKSYLVPGESISDFQAPEHDIQQRVMEAERHQREGRLWLVALVAGIASVVSAIAAGISAYLALEAASKLVGQ